MSQSQSVVVEWHEFHNDPTSDVYLKSRDGIRLGASSHRLRALSPYWGRRFPLPNPETAKNMGHVKPIEELGMNFDADVLAAVLTFANSPIRQATKAVVADLDPGKIRQLLTFLRMSKCPDALCHITLSKWLEGAQDREARVAIAHTVANWNWDSGLNEALRAISALDFKEIYADSSTFWAFIDGFRWSQQKQLLRTMIQIKDGKVEFPKGLNDIDTAASPGLRPDHPASVSSDDEAASRALRSRRVVGRPRKRPY